MHVGIAGRHADFDRAHRVALQHIELVSPWVDKHKSLIEQKFIDLGRPRKTGDVTKEHNSTFTGWFKKRLLESPAPMPSTEEQKLIFSLSQGPGHNVRTYQSYDINGYRFYTEEKDKNSEYQNSGVTMLSYTDDKTDVKERFYGRIEEIWELDYVGVTMPMFRVRWAKSVEKDGLYFTTMVIPDAKSKTPSAKNEPWVLASQVDQCFFITDPSKPSRVVVRRGKRSIIGMEGEADKQDIDKNGDPKIEEEFDKYFDKPTTYSKHIPSGSPPFFFPNLLLRSPTHYAPRSVLASPLSLCARLAAAQDPRSAAQTRRSAAQRIPRRRRRPGPGPGGAPGPDLAAQDQDQEDPSPPPAACTFFAPSPTSSLLRPFLLRPSSSSAPSNSRASLYLQKCFLDNKRKDNILLAYFPEDTHCVLISIAPKFSLATYFDSGSAKKKNYARIRGVLDDALEGYFKKGGAFKEKAECFRDDGKHKFKHVFEFPCVKQPENSTLDAFYVMHHLKGFVRDSQNLRLPSALRGWAEKLARINDDDLREDFQDTRVKLSHIIIQDVTTGGGPLHQGRALCKRDIEHRLKAQGDTRTWITKDLYKPFPEPCEP
ncbi:hypothetical protein QYE76_023757 [Lolium multiflorum]|uniref:Uncharacterized protein n=1 Tax=Lolium multiflorum TaxID=4521 RepID=A0AAD8RB62_LOLMU|nr:hypothetical protein QYE76_023757 [Lolium multiflorum]